MKKYKCGLYVGRFQPLHLGHYNVISQMFEECETVIVAVGSAQECGTERNPFSYGLRASLISRTFMAYYNRLIVIPVDDREHPSNDPSWGDYLFDIVKKYTGLTPDVIYEGEEAERSTWYDNHDIHVETISRTIVKISGTEVRQSLLTGCEEAFCIKTPYAVSFEYEKLREELLKCYNSQKM